MKKIICLIVCMCVVAGTTLIPVYANGSNEKNNFFGNVDTVSYPTTYEGQKDEILSNRILNEEQKDIALAKLDFAYNIDNEKTRAMKELLNNRSITVVTRNIPHFVQENNWYCGPATTKQSIHYLNSSSASQQSIAAAIGTTQSSGSSLVNMMNYLNARIAIPFLMTSPTDKAHMEHLINFGVGISDMPVIIGVRMNSGQGWPYTTTSGHFMNVAGQRNPSSIQYYVVDSEVTRRVSTYPTGKYWMGSSSVYNGLWTNQNRLIW
ncbi:MAG: hypothetical protein FWH14_07730 [Oscillospiraceae bacterium]|nr:hypothetical protein [Oscillospiraceae bacterium]